MSGDRTKQALFDDLGPFGNKWLLSTTQSYGSLYLLLRKAWVAPRKTLQPNQAAAVADLRVQLTVSIRRDRTSSTA